MIHNPTVGDHSILLPGWLALLCLASVIPAAIARGAAWLLREPRRKQQVARLRMEFDAYRPCEIIAATLPMAHRLPLLTHQRTQKPYEYSTTARLVES